MVLSLLAYFLSTVSYKHRTSCNFSLRTFRRDLHKMHHPISQNLYSWLPTKRSILKIHVLIDLYHVFLGFLSVACLWVGEAHLYPFSSNWGPEKVNFYVLSQEAIKYMICPTAIIRFSNQKRSNICLYFPGPGIGGQKKERNGVVLATERGPLVNKSHLGSLCKITCLIVSGLIVGLTYIYGETNLLI